MCRTHLAVVSGDGKAFRSEVGDEEFLTESCLQNVMALVVGIVEFLDDLQGLLMPWDFPQIVPSRLHYRRDAPSILPFLRHVSFADMIELLLISARTKFNGVPPSRILLENLALLGLARSASLQAKGHLFVVQPPIGLAVQPCLVHVGLVVHVFRNVRIVKVHLVQDWFLGSHVLVLWGYVVSVQRGILVDGFLAGVVVLRRYISRTGFKIVVFGRLSHEARHCVSNDVALGPLRPVIQNSTVFGQFRRIRVKVLLQCTLDVEVREVMHPVHTTVRVRVSTVLVVLLAVVLRSLGGLLFVLGQFMFARTAFGMQQLRARLAPCRTDRRDISGALRLHGQTNSARSRVVKHNAEARPSVVVPTIEVVVIPTRLSQRTRHAPS